MNINHKRLKRIFQVFVAIFLLIIETSLFSQSIDWDEQKDGVKVERESFGTRSKERVFEKEAGQAARGNDKYFRFSVHDGNLVTGGVTNSGLLSYHYVSGCPRFSWPKGSRVVSYIHSGVFYVSAEVVDANGDTIHIVSDNYRRSDSELSNDYSHMFAFMPLGKYFNMDQPEAQETPEISGINEDVGIDGIPNTGDFGENDGILQTAEDFNRNGILDLGMQNEVGWFAISHRRETWPEYWPAGSYPGDTREIGQESPGVRAGRWNGVYGAYVRADQESYYVMDDRENDEFEYYPTDDTRSWPDGRRGLGINVEVRNYQWNARLAEDLFISIYDITNEGKDLEKCIVGMYVDPDMGGSMSGDDADFDNIDDITYAWNKTFRSENGLPMGYFGFAFLESPGLAKDGIDNDEDGYVDESQNNGIDDDGDWRTWEDLNGNGEWDSEDLNYNLELDPGEDENGNGILDIEPLNDDLGADGLGPFYEGYTGPDIGEANGQPDPGEPNFEFTDNDESDQVGLTSWYLRDVDDTVADDENFWDIEIQPGTYTIRPGYQRDIAWTYGSGFVEFAGTEKSHRYAIALLFGNDRDDILRNKRTMQVIYDNDYNFSKPPRKPILKAMGGDGKVYLEWNTIAEKSRDPVYGQDFEAYYIYKSTEPTFNEIKTITDAFGNPLLFKPLAIFDLDNGLKGVHPIRIGSELGPESDLGISYNMGTDSGLKHFYVDSAVTNGRSYYYALVSVDQGYHESFYPEITDREGLLPVSPTECGANIQIDPLGRPIGYDPNTAVVIPSEAPAGWVEPELADDDVKHISGNGSGSLDISVFNPMEIKDNHTYRLEFGDDGRFENFDTTLFTGITNQMTIYSSTNGDGVALKTVNNPENNPEASEFIVDGLQLFLKNDSLGIKSAEWISGNSQLLLKDVTIENSGTPVQRDYEIRIGEVGADSAVFGNVIETNFSILDVTNASDIFQVDYLYMSSRNDSTKSMLKHGDRLIIVNNPNERKQLWKWNFALPHDSVAESMQIPQQGDVMKIVSGKTFTRNDVFEITVNGNTIVDSKIKEDLNNIYVVPDPYIALSTLERKVINEEEGRGDRRIDFVNVPQTCTIRIFTSSGKLVRRIDHRATEKNSRAIWDLRTKDGLEIAHGIYFFVVETPSGDKMQGKFAVIK